MKPLIFSTNNNKYDDFEKNGLSRNLKGALELNNVPYCVSVYDESYSLVHFLDLEDYKHYRGELKENTKKVISLFYCEEDKDNNVFEKKHNESCMIKKGDIELYNEFDAIFVPCEEAKRLLLLNGIKTRVFAVNHGVNINKFALENTYIKNIAYRYLKCPDEMDFVVTVINARDEEAFKLLNNLAISFPKIKFIAIYQHDFISPIIKKCIKKAPTNLIYTFPLEDDIYLSLVYNAKVYLFIGSNKGCVIENYEAMAYNTQIIALKNAVFTDIIIDKENGYVYNDFTSLKAGIMEFIDGKLPPLTQNAKEIAIKNSLKSAGEKLIRIYNNI
jgi:Glycosyltransferase